MLKKYEQELEDWVGAEERAGESGEEESCCGLMSFWIF